ncbi:MAG: SMP-30/gluconolactonase/LRE family protein [Spirochaetaceae bacterium]
MWTIQADLAFRAEAQLGEGALWDSSAGKLRWVDIERGHLMELDVVSGDNKTIDLGEKVGTVVPRSRGGVVVALEHSIEAVAPDGRRERLAEFDKHAPGNRGNDGKCDPQGRFWFGSMSPEAEPGQASLYRLDPDLSLHRMLSGVSISNGIVWTRDGGAMFYIDTPTREVWRFAFDPETGTISDKQVALRIPQELGYPDGMTIDAQDRVWIAMFGGHGVTVWDPYGGSLLGKVEVPAKNVTSCAFGGPNLDRLFVTTARILTTDEELARHPYAGSVFVAETEAQGLSQQAFEG